MNHSVIANSIETIFGTKGDASLGVIALWMLQAVYGDTERVRFVRLVELEAKRGGRLETTAARPNEAKSLRTVSIGKRADFTGRVSSAVSLRIHPRFEPRSRGYPRTLEPGLDTERRDERLYRFVF